MDKSENNERSRLDEAVEAAVIAGGMVGWDYIDKRMKSALLAALPVLLGEPKWWVAECYADELNWDEQVKFHGSERDAREDEAEGFKVTALYAPSLGEGGYD